MSIEAGLIAYLKTKPGVTDLAGSGAAYRIRADFLEESDIQTGPSAVVMNAGNNPTAFMGGVANTSSVTLTVDCWASTPADAKGLANAIANVTNGFPCLGGKAGLMGDQVVRSCFAKVVDVPPEIAPDLRELNMYGRRVELRMMVEESSPTFV
ncbi:MAG TPA: hypothetical protein VF175_09575 [Lacipirellula sp.]